MMILYWFAWFNTGRTKSSNGMEGTRFSHPSYFFPRILNFLILKHLSTNHFIWSINLAIYYLISPFMIYFSLFPPFSQFDIGIKHSTSHHNLLVQECCSKPYHRPAIILQYYPELFSKIWWKQEICGLLFLALETACAYDSIATVGESRVWWRAAFQSGSRVLKKPFLIYIYGIQCDFMPKSCWKHSNFENH